MSFATKNEEKTTTRVLSYNHYIYNDEPVLSALYFSIFPIFVLYNDSKLLFHSKALISLFFYCMHAQLVRWSHKLLKTVSIFCAKNPLSFSHCKYIIFSRRLPCLMKFFTEMKPN